MTKRCIGIDFDSSEMRAVQVARRGDQFRLEKVHRSPLRRKSDLAPDSLRSLVRRHGFHRRAAAAVSLSNYALFFHHINTASDSPTPVSMKDDFPVSGPQTIIERYPIQDPSHHEHSALMIAATRIPLKQQVELLQKVQIRCELAEAPVFALHAAVTANHPEFAAGVGIIIYQGDSHIIIAVTQNKNVLTARNITYAPQTDTSENSAPPPESAALLREIEITWRSVFAEKIPEKTPVVLAGRISGKEDLQNILQQKLLCRTIVFNPSQQVDCTDPSQLTPELCIAEGLALRALSPHKTAGANFIKAGKETRQKKTNLKKQLYLAMILISAVAAAWLAGLTARKTYLENQYANIKKQITQTFGQTLPEENIIGDELAQLAQLDVHLKSLQSRYAKLAPLADRTLAPLEVLHLITINTPNRLVRIDELWIDPQTIRLAAYCDSFASLDEWHKRLLKIPQFNSVEVQDRRKISDQVHFMVIISLISEKY
ncbi:MAG: hypothetical protein AMJ79_04990 [Phycisphaerae bacterium SM23_30]|nr:MAG: hypothetical protein AMJ79_04990 [Phycisphaerae bacterium SM23_30]